MEGRSAAEVKTDLSLDSVENTAISTWAGSGNLTTVGTVVAGTWSADTIAVTKGGTGKTSITQNSFLKGGRRGIPIPKGTYSEVKTDLSLDSVENTALSTWAGSANLTTLGTVTSGGLGAGASVGGVTMSLGSDADGDMYYRASNVSD